MAAKKIAVKDEPKFGEVFDLFFTMTIMVPKRTKLDPLKHAYLGVKVGNGGFDYCKNGTNYSIRQCINEKYSNEEIFHDQLVIFSKCCKLDDNFKSKDFDLYNLPIFVRKDAAK